MKRLALCKLVTVFLVFCSLVIPANLLGQTKSAKSDDNMVQLGVAMVSLNVTVVDHNGNFVVGLNQNNFEVYEDKIKQDVVNFTLDDAPLSVGIIFDLSGSMKSKIRGAHDSLRSFTHICRDDDNIFVLGFNNHVQLLRDYTSDDGEVLSSVLGAEPKGLTALYDAVYMGMEKAKQGRNARKVLLVISDGQDNDSRYTLREIERFAKESDVLIYSIGIIDSEICRRWILRERMRSTNWLILRAVRLFSPAILISSKPLVHILRWNYEANITSVLFLQMVRVMESGAR